MQTIYYGGDILTMKDKTEMPEAVLVKDGKILFVGELSRAEVLSGKNVQKFNLEGKTLMPAFIDAHSHISVAALFSNAVILTSCTSFAGIRQTLSAHMQAEKEIPDEIVVGFGYDHNFLEEKRHPDKFVLDSVSDRVPILILHTSLHMGVVNSVFLKKIGIGAATQDPDGGKIGRVDGTSEPDGYLEEKALQNMFPFLFQHLNGRYSEQIVQVQNLYLSYGITTAQDGASGSSDIHSLSDAAKHNQLKIDIVSYALAGKEEPGESIRKYPEYDRMYTNHFKIGGYKLVLDGSPQGKSAWLTKPYAEEKEYCGYPTMKDTDVERYLCEAVDGNYQTLVHCNGDAAGDQFIRCYKSALKRSSNTNKNNLRPVMIHCQTVRDDQLDEMAALHMIPSIFVAHTYFWGDVHLKNLGAERGNRISPAHSALARGLKINFHQDSPVLPPDMLMTVWCAVNRQTRSGVPVGSDESIDVFDALKAVTINAAYEYFEENSKGTLEKGKLADMVVLDANPLRCNKKDIKNIKVVQTIKEGRTLYSLKE